MKNTYFKHFSKRIQGYLYTIKLKGRNEAYETLILMLLNDKLLLTFEETLDKALDNILIKDGKMSINTTPSEEYIKTISDVCKSKYFRENFTKYEILKKKKVMDKILSEAIVNIVLAEKAGIKYSIVENYSEYSLIEHQYLKRGEKIKITFDKNISIDELTFYAKEILQLKNHPKKKKLSLGKNTRLLAIDDSIKAKKESIKEPYNYIEELTRKEYEKKYKDNISIENTLKSLQRIRKIRKEINEY
jgi:hypothetical protein